MVVEPFHTWPKTIKPAPEPKSGPTKEQIDRWTASYAVADAGSLGAPAAPAQKTADAAARALDTRPVVGSGSSGGDILDQQSKLDALGFDLGSADGVYGPKTEAAVREFQKSQGITVDGIIGPETRQKLDALQNPWESIDAGSLYVPDAPPPNPYEAADLGSLTPVPTVRPEPAGNLPERVDIVHADIGASAGPLAAGKEVIYRIEYLPNGEALITRHIEVGGGGNADWRAGTHVNAGNHGEGGFYVGGGGQLLAEGLDGSTFRVPADQAEDLVRRDAHHLAAVNGTALTIGLGSGGLLTAPALGLGERIADHFPQTRSPLVEEGTQVGSFVGIGLDGQVDGLAEVGIHDAEWLGPLQNFFGESVGAEVGASTSATTYRDLETGGTRTRVNADVSGSGDIAFLNIKDENGDSVFGIDGNAEGQATFSVDVISNDQGEVTEVIVGTSGSDGETVNTSQWTLDATDPALAQQIQDAMSGRDGSIGNIEQLTRLAFSEGERENQTYERSSTDYGAGADFFPLPDIGVGGSVGLTIERLES